MAERVKLSKRIIDAAEPEEREYHIWDTEIRGLGLRVRPGGSKVFIYMFRREDGKQRKLTLGLFGRITLEEARKAADDARAKVAQGEDPTEDKKAARQPMPEPEPEHTLRQLVDRYLDKGKGRTHKPSTQREDRRLLNKIILPKLGETTPVVSITRADVAVLREDLGDHPAQANAALRRLSAILSYAEDIGWRDEQTNPCRAVEHYTENKRTRYLTAEELGRLGKVLAAEEARRGRKDKKDPPKWSRSAALLVELLLYTGLRPGEVLSLKWEYLDADRGLLRLPDTKTGARIVPLSATALEFLKNVPHIDGNPWVLPGARKNSHLSNPNKPWALIRERAGLSDVHLHDLRHTVASWGVSGGSSLYVVGGILGHKQASTTERYAHLAQDPVKQAVDRTAEEIAGALQGKPPAKVVNLSR